MPARKGTFRSDLRGRRAVAGLEFALLLPVMLLIAAGSVETGAILRAYDATDRLAAQYAISYADCSEAPIGACQSELGLYWTSAAIANVAPQLNAANLTLQMFRITMTGTAPTIQYSYPAGASLSAAQIAAAQASIQPGRTGIVVSAAYNYTLMFFPSVMAPFYGPQVKIAHTVVQLVS